jgi:uncharacterized protein (DUF1800 family)
MSPAMTKVTRRQVLRAMALLAAGGAVSGATSACSAVQSRVLNRIAGQPTLPETQLNADPAIVRALSRMTFGPRADELAHAQAIGLAGWVEEQLVPERIDDAGVAVRLSRFDTLTLSAGDIRDWSAQMFDDSDTHAPVAELRSATLLRQIYSRRQLYETVVDFWSDHFNIHVLKGECWYLKTVDDRDVIRPHALGSFRELLSASARSPAMLVYLDNQASDASHPNENYARELLELHTLGVDGGYTQRDVMELARCLTGWRVGGDTFQHDQFMFDADMHDHGAKTVLGMTIPPGGVSEADAVIQRLAAHPATAQRLAHKLARRYLGANPPAAIVTRAATAYANSNGEIVAALRPILLDGLVKGAPQPQHKRPLHFITSALRALNADTDAGAPLLDALARMGQPAFGWPTPDGYPDHDTAWQNNLLPRWQFALALANDELTGTRVEWDALNRWLDHQSPDARINVLTTMLTGAAFDAQRRALLREALGDDASTNGIAAALIASPHFRWR